MEALLVSNQCPPNQINAHQLLTFESKREGGGVSTPYEKNREALISLRGENLGFQSSLGSSG